MQIVTDQHPIDYEGRRKDYELLKSWDEGKGTAYQQQLGSTGRMYGVINGYLSKTYKLTGKGRQFMGMAV